MHYIDANVFLLAAADRGPRGVRAAQCLRDVVAGDAPGAISTLTFDEVVWIFTRMISREEAIRQGERLLSLPNLKVLSTTPDHAKAALRLLRTHASLRPRDAMHAAVALGSGISTIVSGDADFDVIPGLTRISLG